MVESGREIEREREPCRKSGSGKILVKDGIAKSTTTSSCIDMLRG